MLGPPEIYQRGQPLRISRRSTRNLLFYLACRRGMVARDELAFLFWGNKPDEIARKRLSETISRLRGSLANPDWILTEPDLVGLDLNSIYTDLHEFKNLIDPVLALANQIPLDQPLPQPIYQKITKAISIWRGPKCLAGTNLSASFEMEHWFLSKASEMEQIYLNLLERISYHALASTNLEECLFYARQGLSADNSHEGFHSIVLRTLLTMGRSAQAREHYQSRIRPLEEEGYFFSNSGLQELIHQINESKPAGPSRSIQPRWDMHETIKVPFVGRQPLLDKLWQQFYKGGGALILGEKGQGKTRLLEQFISQAAPTARLLTTTCHSGENRLELQPLIELIRDHFEEQDWLAIPAPWAAQLVRLFPELIELRPELHQIFSEAFLAQISQTSQSNLFEALRQAIWAIAQSDKLLLCIDEIHWADETTLAALTYFLERPPFTDQSLIVLSAQTGEPQSHANRLEQYLRQLPHGNVLNMTGLTLEETGTFISTLLTRTPSEAFIQNIYADCGGNPLYILETIRTVLEQGIDLTDDQVTPIPVPNKIIQLIQQRLNDLSQPERDLLEIAAIYGTEFDPAVIQDASEYKLDQFAIFLDKLTERLVIEPLSETPNELHYRFIHSKFREVVLDEIPDLRRRWLHRKVANALSRHPVLPYNHPAILAEHYEKSSDPTTAFQFWILSAQQARRSNAITNALEYFTHAEQQLMLATDITTRQIHEFYGEWSKIAYETERLELVEQISNALMRIGYERRSDLLIGAAHDTLSDAYMLQKKFGEALNSSLQTEKYLNRTGHSLAKMQMYIRRGQYLFLLHRISEAELALQSALEQPGDDKDPRYLQSVANTHKQLAMLSMLSGWPSEKPEPRSRCPEILSNHSRSLWKSFRL